MTETGPDPIDLHVGARIKAQRLLAGLTQNDLAKKIGLTFQQMQKYEAGVTRVAPSRLMGIAQALNVRPEWFFADLPEDIQNAFPAHRSSVEPDKAQIHFEIRRETLELLKVLQALTPEQTAVVKQNIMSLASLYPKDAEVSE